MLALGPAPTEATWRGCPARHRCRPYVHGRATARSSGRRQRAAGEHVAPLWPSGTGATVVVGTGRRRGDRACLHGGVAHHHNRVSRRRVGAMVAGTPALQTRAVRRMVSADARASVVSRRPVCVGGPVSTIQADAELQSRIRAPTRQHTPARSAPPIRKDEAALTRGSAVDRRAGRRRGPPAGTERLRRVRLHGTSESEWDMEGR